MPTNKIDIGEEILSLHAKRIGKGKSGKHHFTYDELSPFRDAALFAPRIGKVGNGRKQDDELIVITRGLMMRLIDEARYGQFIHEKWMNGELEKLDSGEGL